MYGFESWGPRVTLRAPEVPARSPCRLLNFMYSNASTDGHHHQFHGRGYIVLGTERGIDRPNDCLGGSVTVRVSWES